MPNNISQRPTESKRISQPNSTRPDNHANFLICNIIEEHGQESKPPSKPSSIHPAFRVTSPIIKATLETDGFSQCTEVRDGDDDSSSDDFEIDVGDEKDYSIQEFSSNDNKSYHGYIDNSKDTGHCHFPGQIKHQHDSGYNGDNHKYGE